MDPFWAAAGQGKPRDQLGSLAGKLNTLGDLPGELLRDHLHAPLLVGRELTDRVNLLDAGLAESHLRGEIIQLRANGLLLVSVERHIRGEGRRLAGQAADDSLAEPCAGV